MDLRLVILLLLWVFSGRAVYAQDASPIELELSGYSYITPVPVYLSEDDKRWLLQKERYASGFINRNRLRWCKPRSAGATGDEC
jgi:two-component system sensor histidine kinase EvgS